MTEKTSYLGKESGKSSARFFGGASRVMHEKGDGASAGDGRTTDKKVAGRIKPEFKNAREN